MMLASASPPHRNILDQIEGRRRLIEATREASRWHKPQRRIIRKEAGK